MFNAYNYLAAVDRIIDGDTIVITVDTGFYLKYKTQVRLLRVNAPETRGASREKGLETKEFLSKTIPVGSTIYIHTEKDDAFGRWLAEVFYLDKDGKAKNLGSELLEKGLACLYTKHKTQEENNESSFIEFS